jgi:hypothetical protein
LDFVAQTYAAHSRPLNSARCVNFFAEAEQQDAKSKAPIGVWGAAGIAPFVDLADPPIKAFNIMNNILYVVGGANFWQINADGSVANLGAHSAIDTVSIDNNGVAVVWVDGLTGWSYQPGIGVAQITDPNFFPSNTVTYFDGYFVFVNNGTKEFYLSPLFWLQSPETPFDATQFASKEATSDLLLGIANSHEQLYLFGQLRIEIWYDAGNPAPQFPFQRSDGAIIQRGTQAPLSIILEDNTLFFLGEDGIAYRVNGFVPERISNHAVENTWATYPTLTDCKALIYTTLGHKMLTLTFPTAQTTWVCDLSTRRWHERESWIGSSQNTSIGRWRGNCAINAFGRILIGDVATGQVGQLSYNDYTEWGDTMRGLLDGPPIHTDRRRVFMRRFELDVESGIGLPGAVGPVANATYTMHAVTITQPTTLVSAGALAGLGNSVNQGLLSVWLDIPDGGDLTGLVISSGGFSLTAVNDATRIPEIAITMTDALGDQIVTATFDYATWGSWVNLLVSFDIALRLLQVWASTLVDDLLVESLLTPVAITWGSALPFVNIAAWTIEPYATGSGGGGSPVLQWSDNFESYAVGANTITSPWLNTSPSGPTGGVSSLISDSVVHLSTQSLGLCLDGGSAEGAGIVQRSATLADTDLGPTWTLDVYVFMPTSTGVPDPPESNAPGFYLENTSTGGLVRFYMGGDGTCYINVAGQTSSGAWHSFDLSLGAWHHLTWQVTMAASGTSALIIDGGSPDTFTGDTRTNGADTSVNLFAFVGQFIDSSPPVEIYFDDVSLYSGTYTPGTISAVTLGDLWFGSTATYVNLDVVATRRLFVGQGGGTQFLGSDGSIPFGYAPAIYNTWSGGGSPNAWAVNAGTGGAFTVTSGNLTAASGPSPPSGTYTIPAPIAPNTPIGADPQIRLSVSDDGGRTYSALQKWRSMGKQGEYLKRLRWLKMGQFRQRTIRLEVTDPVRRNIVGVYLDVSEGLD